VRTVGFPLSSSWGQHSCIYVAGAAAAIMAAAITPKTCRGRCLSQGNETFDFGNFTTTSNALQNSFDLSRDSTNLTESSYSLNMTTVGSLPGSDRATSNGTEIGPLSDLDISQPLITANNSGSAGVDLDGLSSNQSHSGPSEESATGHVILSGTNASGSTAVMHCPCNCTYVSTACCLSRVVHEDTSMRIHMNPLPVNSSVCCDPNSGRWLPKHSNECSSNVSNTDFTSLGSVRWNDSGTVPRKSHEIRENRT
jgi:hypothetical protein